MKKVYLPMLALWCCSFLYSTAQNKVGIGTTTPAFKLDVFGGSINTDTDYRLASLKVLTQDTNFNLAVGHNAGHNTTGMFNTFCGTAAGSPSVSGNANSFFGQQAGKDNAAKNY